MAEFSGLDNVNGEVKIFLHLSEHRQGPFF